MENVVRLITPEIQNYFDEVSSRIADAEEAPFEAVSLPCGWTPKPAECHKNVDHWTAQPRHRHLKVVRGWLTWGKDASGLCMLTAHSVVEENGKLKDITPVDSDTPPSWFVRHAGAKESFDAMQPEWSWTTYPLEAPMSNESAEIPDPWQ
jgi:hypothetical protein